MNRLLRNILAIIVTLISCELYAQNQIDDDNQDSLSITYMDNFISSDKVSVRIPMRSQEERNNPKGSDIIENYVIKDIDSLTFDKLKKSVKAAISEWESHILGGVNYFIDIKYEDIPCDVMTTVRYEVGEEGIIPSALFAYEHNNTDRGEGTSDGTITINKSKEWDYGINENMSADGNNLTYALLRAIARILGFGSSVTYDENGDYVFAFKRSHTVFNTFVENAKGKKLSSLRVKGGRPSAELTEYINDSDGGFFLNVNNQKYELESPPFDCNNPPFSFVKDKHSLMSSSLRPGSYILCVDSITKNVMKALKWNLISEDDVRIIGENIPETGMISAYDNAIFHITTTLDTTTFTNKRWRFEFIDNEGNPVRDSLMNNSTSFILPASLKPSEYQINQDGNIEKKVTFLYDINGKTARSNPFKVFLGLEPSIDTVIIVKKVENPLKKTYDAYYEVKYRGASSIRVNTEKENSSKIQVKVIKEPYIASGIAENLPQNGYAWLDFFVQNKYGKVHYTMEFEPINASYKVLASLEEPIDALTINVYDIMGHPIYRDADKNILNSLPVNNIFIVMEYQNGDLVKTYKYLNK